MPKLEVVFPGSRVIGMVGRRRRASFLLIKRNNELTGRLISIITNQVTNGCHLASTYLELPVVELVAIFEEELIC